MLSHFDVCCHMLSYVVVCLAARKRCVCCVCVCAFVRLRLRLVAFAFAFALRLCDSRCVCVRLPGIVAFAFAFAFVALRLEGCLERCVVFVVACVAFAMAFAFRVCVQLSACPVFVLLPSRTEACAAPHVSPARDRLNAVAISARGAIVLLATINAVR